MKKFNLIIATFVLALFATSCHSYQSTAPLMGIGGNSLNTYAEADIDYENAKKVEATVDSKTYFWFFTVNKDGNKMLKSANRYKGLTNAERQALYKAKVENGVDVILDPEFVVEKHTYFLGLYKKSKIRVKGWGANVKGIKEDKHGIPNANINQNSGLFH